MTMNWIATTWCYECQVGICEHVLVVLNGYRSAVERLAGALRDIVGVCAEDYNAAYDLANDVRDIALAAIGEGQE
jgi:hypothetical protein